MPDAKDFYEHLVNKIVIKFMPKLATQAENRIFELTLNKKMSYDQVLWCRYRSLIVRALY